MVSDKRAYPKDQGYYDIGFRQESRPDSEKISMSRVIIILVTDRKNDQNLRAYPKKQIQNIGFRQDKRLESEDVYKSRVIVILHLDRKMTRFCLHIDKSMVHITMFSNGKSDQILSAYAKGTASISKILVIKILKYWLHMRAFLKFRKKHDQIQTAYQNYSIYYDIGFRREKWLDSAHISKKVGLKEQGYYIGLRQHK